MILQSLCTYYDRIAESESASIAPDGFSTEKAHFALVIDGRGKLLQVRDLREVSDGGTTTTRRRRLELTDCHECRYPF